MKPSFKTERDRELFGICLSENEQSGFLYGRGSKTCFLCSKEYSPPISMHMGFKDRLETVIDWAFPQVELELLRINPDCEKYIHTCPSCYEAKTTN